MYDDGEVDLKKGEGNKNKRVTIFVKGRGTFAKSGAAYRKHVWRGVVPLIVREGEGPDRLKGESILMVSP